MSADALPRTSTVDALAAALRGRILDGDLAAGERLVERELTGRYAVARHTLRAALRALAAEGLVRVEPHRGARVAALGPDDVRGLYDLRTALEVEAARRALAAHDERVPPAVRAALEALTRACARRRPRWAEIVEAHEALHGGLVAAGGSPRLRRAHEALAAETRLFMLQLRPLWSVERMAAGHEALVRDLEARGAEALRGHLDESATAVVAALEGGRPAD